MKSYFGTKHKFTTSANDEYIELAAGTDEHLRIREIYNEVINSNIDTDALGDSALSNKEDETHTSAVVNQGVSTFIGKSGSDYYIGGGLNYTIYPSVSTGGAMVFNNTGGGAFSEYATVLINTSASPYGDFGQKSSINQDATKIAFTDGAWGGAKSVNIYKRTGANWAIYKLLTGYLNTLFGSYAAIHSGTQAIVYLDNGTDYLLQATLLTSSAVSYMVSNGDNTVVLNDGLSVKIYQRTLTTWALTQTIVSPAAILNIKITDKFLIFCTNANIYTYVRANTLTGTLFNAYDVLPFSNPIDICSRTFTAGSSFLFVLTTAGIIIYKNQLANDFWALETNSIDLTLGTSINCLDDYLVVGKPTANTKGQLSIFSVSDYTNSELIPPNNIINIAGIGMEITSGYGAVDINQSLSVLPTGVTISEPLYLGPTLCDFNSAVYYATASQAISTGTVVIFPFSLLNNLSYITYSAGTFTNTSGYAINLLVSYSIRTVLVADLNTYIARSGSTMYFGQNMNSLATANSAFSGSSILNIPIAGTFYVGCYTNTVGATISAGAAFQASQISITRIL